MSEPNLTLGPLAPCPLTCTEPAFLPPHPDGGLCSRRPHPSPGTSCPARPRGPTQAGTHLSASTPGLSFPTCAIGNRTGGTPRSSSNPGNYRSARKQRPPYPHPYLSPAPSSGNFCLLRDNGGGPPQIHCFSHGFQTGRGTAEVPGEPLWAPQQLRGAPPSGYFHAGRLPCSFPAWKPPSRAWRQSAGS